MPSPFKGMQEIIADYLSYIPVIGKAFTPDERAVTALHILTHFFLGVVVFFLSYGYFTSKGLFIAILVLLADIIFTEYGDMVNKGRYIDVFTRLAGLIMSGGFLIWVKYLFKG